MRAAPRATAVLLFLLALLAGSMGGCGKKGDMVDQPRARPLGVSDFFDDRGWDRNLMSGVVPRGSTPAAAPPPLDRALLERGRESFAIHCAPCHGLSGYGRGMVVRRGYPRPPSYHGARQRRLTDDDLYRVIMNGRGKMPPYAARVRHFEERWAIIHYLRALQLSQNGRLDQVPAEERRVLERRGGTGRP